VAAKSAPVMIFSTPGIASAAVVLMLLMVACAISDRTKTAMACLCRLMSAV
jgi:hypothetical protein